MGGWAPRDGSAEGLSRGLQRAPRPVLASAAGTAKSLGCDYFPEAPLTLLGGAFASGRGKEGGAAGPRR